MKKNIAKTTYKKDISIIEDDIKKHDERFDNLDKSVSNIEKLMYTHVDHVEFMKWLNENMYTKKDHSKFMEWMDEAMTEIRDSRDERILRECQLLRHDDTLFEHNKRIGALEAKIPAV